MKTVMKKLLSLMLVAVLLVSAVPFQASAATAEEHDYDVNVYVTIDGEPVNTLKHIYINADEKITVDEALAKEMVRDWNGREFDCWTNSLGNSFESATLDGSVLADMTDFSLTICLKSVPTEDPSEEPEDPSEEPEDPSEEPEKTTTTVTFNAGVNGIFTREWKQYQVVEDLPAAPDLKGHKFVGWFSGKDGKGEEIELGDKWSGEYEFYYAYYKESTDDDISTLSVYAKIIVGSTVKQTVKLYDQDFKDGDAMLTWLQNHESTTSDAIFNIVRADDYEWSPRYYYNYSGNEPLTAQNLIANGDKSIVVKVYAKEATQANVLLYIHKDTKTSSPAAIYEMSGYTAGDTVTLSAAKTIINKHYTGSNMTVTGLYSDTAWKQLLNGENPTAANGIKVENNGTMKVHVILKNATASENGEKSDSTNPKTGDMIFVPMIFMLVSAAAIVACVYGKKRMVK